MLFLRGAHIAFAPGAIIFVLIRRVIRVVFFQFGAFLVGMYGCSAGVSLFPSLKLFGLAIFLPQAFEHLLMNVMGSSDDVFDLMTFVGVFVNEVVVVSSIQFNQVGKVVLEVDEEGCAKILNVIPNELQPLDQLFIRNTHEFFHFAQLVTSHIQLLQLLELFNTLQGGQPTVSQTNYPCISVLSRKLVYLEHFLGVAEAEQLLLRVEVGLLRLQIVRKHNGIIIPSIASHCTQRIIQIYLRSFFIYQSLFKDSFPCYSDKYGALALQIIWMKQDRMLSLCDAHSSIIHQFGCEGSCMRSAGVCLRGCSQYQHQQKAGRHEFIGAKEFYAVVGSVRERYQSFTANFKQVFLRKYVEEAAACVSSFQEFILGEFLEKNPMIDIFCKYSSGGDIFQQLVEEPLDQVEFAQVRCRDVFQLRHFEQSLQRETAKQQEQRMMKLLSKVFEHHLRTHKILLTHKPTQERRTRLQEMMEADRLEALTDTLQRKITTLEYAQRQEKVEELLIILRTDLKDYEQNSPSAETLGKLFTNLQGYLEKTLPERLHLAVNFPLAPTPFWQKFGMFIGGKALKQVSIWTTADPLPAREVETQMSRRYQGVLPVSFKHNARWEDVSALIDKRPSAPT